MHTKNITIIRKTINTGIHYIIFKRKKVSCCFCNDWFSSFDFHKVVKYQQPEVNFLYIIIQLKDKDIGLWVLLYNLTSTIRLSDLRITLFDRWRHSRMSKLSKVLSSKSFLWVQHYTYFVMA